MLEFAAPRRVESVGLVWRKEVASDPHPKNLGELNSRVLKNLSWGQVRTDVWTEGGVDGGGSRSRRDVESQRDAKNRRLRDKRLTSDLASRARVTWHCAAIIRPELDADLGSVFRTHSTICHLFRC